MPQHSRLFRATLLVFLYVSQAVPLGFFIVAIPAILRSRGLPLEQLGLLSALALPWLLKFGWAPLVDLYGSSRGHYRSWILPLQLSCVGVVLVIATLDLSKGLSGLIVAGALFMLCSATQDIATDGLAVRLLAAEERGLGNGIQVGGYYLGQILGGGLVLILFERFGWTAAIGSMALVLALPLGFVWVLQEPRRPVEARQEVGFGAIGHFFRRRAVLQWVGILLLWRAGETMVQWMFNPMLVDRGVPLDEIGLVLGVLGSSASLTGAVAGGLLVQRWGRRPALLLFGALQAMALASYALPALGWGGRSAIYAVVIIAAATGGMATAALYTSMMDRSRSSTAATDFTLQQSLAAIGPLIAAGGSGFSAAALGYAGHFGVAAAVQGGVVVLAAASFVDHSGAERSSGAGVGVSESSGPAARDPSAAEQ